MRNCFNNVIFLSVIEMNLPVVVDQSQEGGFSYYPACRQRCIQCSHYSSLIYYRRNFGARSGQAILGSQKLVSHCFMKYNHTLC